MSIQQILLGVSGASAGQDAYTTSGTYSWVCPSGVSSVSVVCVGAGGGGKGRPNTCCGAGGGGGGGGGLSYANNVAVSSGTSYTVVVWCLWNRRLIYY